MMSLQTPVSYFVALREFGRIVARERRQREERAGLPADELYSVYAPYRDWAQYVGNDLTVPVVSLHVNPKLSETTGSVLLRAFARGFGAATAAKYRYEGDVYDVSLYRNGESVEPLVGGTAVEIQYTRGSYLDVADVANRGFYVYSPEVFSPTVGSVPPEIVVAVDDLKRPEESSENRFTLPPELVARVWNDFAAYYAATKPDQGFTYASAEVKWNAGTVQILPPPGPSTDIIGGTERLLSDLSFITKSMRFHGHAQGQDVIWLVTDSESRDYLRLTLRLSERNTVAAVLTDRSDWERRLLEELTKRFTQ
jgi:hypothetical protein